MSYVPVQLPAADRSTRAAGGATRVRRLETRESSGEPEFYANLPVVDRFVDLADPRVYVPVPASWHVVLTDIEGSTAAVQAGRYRDVNALGVASIVAVRNAVPEVEIPFVFGGDGATLLVPATHLSAVEAALRGLRRMARDAFELEMRAGIVPVRDLATAGYPVRVARYRVSSDVELAMLAGEGLSVAEAWVKGAGPGSRFTVDEVGREDASYEGFECRWEPVSSRRGSVLTLIVRATTGFVAGDAGAYRKLLEQLDAIVALDVGCPVTADGLRLARRWADLRPERRIRSHSRGMTPGRLALRVATGWALGRLLLATGARAAGFDGSRYRQELAANCDFRKFDGNLRLVIDVSDEERAAIERLLDAEYQAGRLVYGCHASESALITCFVGTYSGDHVHFIDGADGGYTRAAQSIKQRLFPSPVHGMASSRRSAGLPKTWKPRPGAAPA